MGQTLGCTTASKLNEQVQQLEAELESTKRSLQVATELKEAFSLELQKRRAPETEEEKAKQRTDEGSASLSDSLRDEWNKVKEWVETEVTEGNEIMTRLLKLADFDESSEEAQDMRRRTQRVVDSNYDADLLVDFSLRRSRIMKALLDKVGDDRSQLVLHLKVVEEQLKAMVTNYEGGKVGKDLQDKLTAFRSGQVVDKVKTVSAFLRVALEAQSGGDGARAKQLEERFEELKRLDESKARELNSKTVQIRHLESQLKEHSRGEADTRLKQLEAESKVKDMEITQLRERLQRSAEEVESKKMLETEVNQLKLALQIAKSSQESGNQVEWLQSQLLETSEMMKSLEAELAVKVKTLELKDSKIAQNEARLRELSRQKQQLEAEVRGLESSGDTNPRLGQVKKALKDLSSSIDKGLSE